MRARSASRCRASPRGGAHTVGRVAPGETVLVHRAEASNALLARLGDGRRQLEVPTWPLDEGPRAHRRLEGGLTTGTWR